MPTRSQPGYCWPPGEGSLGWLGGRAAACFLASFLACFSARRSRSLLSRASFAIVVFFLPAEAMCARPFLEVASAAVLSKPTGEGLGAHSSEPNSGKAVQILPARVALRPRDGAITHSSGSRGARVRQREGNNRLPVA
jgi:hypothetical protein